jgi:vacuolar-type H+-ATPase subunit F/Vma7
MKQCIFITPQDCRHGFNLAGFSQLVIAADQLEATLLKSMADEAVAMIVIDERLLEGIEQERLEAMEKRWNGIVITLPQPTALKGEEEDYAMRLIRRAVGYHVRLTL